MLLHDGKRRDANDSIWPSVHPRLLARELRPAAGPRERLARLGKRHAVLPGWVLQRARVELLHGGPARRRRLRPGIAAEHRGSLQADRGQHGRAGRRSPGGRRPGLREQLPARLRAHASWYRACRDRGAGRRSTLGTRSPFRSGCDSSPTPSPLGLPPECANDYNNNCRWFFTGAVRTNERSDRRADLQQPGSASVHGGHQQVRASQVPAHVRGPDLRRIRRPATSAWAKPAKPPASIPIPPILRAS